MKEIIAKLHAEWEARCIPRDAPPIQREEMKRAFYSGFIACLVWQLNNVATIEDDGEAASALQSAHDEGEDYFSNLGQRPPPPDLNRRL